MPTTRDYTNLLAALGAVQRAPGGEAVAGPVQLFAQVDNFGLLLPPIDRACAMASGTDGPTLGEHTALELQAPLTTAGLWVHYAAVIFGNSVWYLHMQAADLFNSVGTAPDVYNLSPTAPAAVPRVGGILVASLPGTGGVFFNSGGWASQGNARFFPLFVPPGYRLYLIDTTVNAARTMSISWQELER